MRSHNFNLYHELLRHIMFEFLELQDTHTDSNDGIHMFISNKGYVHFHFELCFVIGDISGHDNLCCHYKGYSKQTSRPVRSCNIAWDDLDDPYDICQFVNSESIYDRPHRKA